ncbi:disulfide bond formation protein B [Marinobacterium nitratireducens]|uniref:Disulfide bond formation protein B n=1 Tax=Marinobacterium nitratireducens TaxID=518897 RepID=A0A917Z9Z0_9GAMM|nr:disulfide bond formation protein B [Marinobacterium nitratireducens]GGO78189.1 disulfide bond formation protein B [Marinobacterium nitratireducens]
MFDRLSALGRSALFWLAMILLGLALEGVALYYQYELGYGPCVLCVHIRLWLAGFILVALLGLLGHGSKPLRLLTLLLAFVTMVGMLERSWKTLGIERGWIEGSCSMESGLPPWFAPDQWWPTLFEIWEPCGYTPELPLGITMAEALVAFGGLMVLFTLAMLVAGLRRG